MHALRGWKDELMRIEGSLLLILLLCGFAFRRAGLRFNKDYCILAKNIHIPQISKQ